MKVILKQALDATVALEALGDKELPIDLSFRVSRLVLRLHQEALPFPESRMALFQKYGCQISGGISIPPENRIAFRADMNALLNATIEIGEIDPLPWPVIMAHLRETGQDFKANHILAMDWLLDFSEVDENTETC
jgi:hypothetical protein